MKTKPSFYEQFIKPTAVFFRVLYNDSGAGGVFMFFFVLMCSVTLVKVIGWLFF